MKQLEEQSVLHPLLQQIDMEHYSAERFQALWDHLSQQDYAFDDLVREDPLKFLSQFMIPNNLFFELGDMDGLVSVVGVQPRLNATLHFANWGKQPITQLMQAGRSLQEWLFTTYALNRLSAYIPDQNLNARRLATLLWFKEEGNLRKAYLNQGHYSDVRLFGLLRSEFYRFKQGGI